MKKRYVSSISRREALERLGVMATSATLVGCVYPSGPDGITNLADLPGWPDFDLQTVLAEGYGTDPVLIAPQPAPWPRTLTTHELNLLAELAEVICPGAASVGVPDVIDEWVSAPYPDQQRDRALIVPGLTWLDRRSKQQFGRSFAALDISQRTTLIEQLDIGLASAPTSMQMPVRFFDRLRILVAGAHFSSAQGVRELGYQGNVPTAGDYPGPSDAALEHLDELLKALDLTP